MKKLIVLLSILLTSLSISAQLIQVSQYWDIQHTILRTQYTVIKSTNEKQGVYKEWSSNRNLVVECNYVKNELNGVFKEYFDVPGLLVRHTVNYKNGQKDGFDKTWNYENKTTNQTLTYEELVASGLKPKIYLSEKKEYKNGEKTNNFIEFSATGDTLEYSNQTVIDANTYIVEHKSGADKSEVKYKRINNNSLYDEEVYRKQWKHDSNHGWYLSLSRDKEKGIISALEYYNNGNKRFEAIDGTPQFIGHKEITYSENGKPKTIKNFKKGEETCFSLTAYDENGLLQSETFSNPSYSNFYENGLLARKDTSDFTIHYYTNGKMRQVINNKLHIIANLDENGTLLNKIEGAYEEKYSIENGNNIKTVYYQKTPIAKYINDKLRFEVKDNTTTEYNENGNKTSEISYKQAQAPYVQTSDGRYYEIGSFYYEKSYSTIGEATIEVKKEFDISGNLSSLKETVNNGKDKDGTEIIITDVTYNSDGTVKTELKRTNNNRTVIYTMFEYEYPKEKQKIKSKQEIKKITF